MRHTAVEAADSPKVTDGSFAASEVCEFSNQFFSDVETFAHLRAMKLYRLHVAQAQTVPRIPCLDHEAMLHEGIAPHAAAYVEDRETGELHEIVLIPSRRRVEIDTASTLQEHTGGADVGLIARLHDIRPDLTYSVNKLSWLRGDRRVARACRAQVALRDVLLGADIDTVSAAIERLRTIAALMEKQSRVASWSVRTVTGPLLTVVGFLVYQGLGRLAPEIGVGTVSTFQSLVVGLAGGLFLYFGLKAVHLTEIANRVWKRAAEYGLIVAERRKLRDSAQEVDGSPGGTVTTVRGGAEK